MTSTEAQILGAAARNPKVQAAAAHAAKDPQVQAAAWKVAQDAARQSISDPRESRGGFLDSNTSANRVNCSIRACCFMVAIALLVSSILGMANVFNAAFHPLQYLLAAYNLLFALVIVIIEGEREWFKRIFDLQGRLFGAAPCLSWRAGRAAFYFYVGSINLLLLPESWIWKIINLCIGGGLCGCGLLMMVQRCCDRGARAEQLPPHVAV